MNKSFKAYAGINLDSPDGKAGARARPFPRRLLYSVITESSVFASVKARAGGDGITPARVPTDEFRASPGPRATLKGVFGFAALFASVNVCIACVFVYAFYYPGGVLCSRRPTTPLQGDGFHSPPLNLYFHKPCEGRGTGYTVPLTTRKG